ncbi:enoyl-CoA hydratase [Agarilytica rhodophyticola]|uniref:enoyl-CoA hydratase n=1 Tax=Agarilytica rhodophyticola TaxID=1737490 RepID=UPI000B343F6C|nr:enoyl-CoA hydratase [Agarilytica rhodophyticola]
MSEAIKLQHHDHTCVLTLNNPPAHTWTAESLHQLADIVETLNKDTNNYALIITGDGEKFFSAGADLNQFNHDDKEKCLHFASAFGDAFQTLANYKGVSIAAINGYAMGGGLEVALACDIRIAEQHALMALPECTVGLLPCGLGTQHLTHLIGEQWAKRMILLGEKVDADKALTLGLISEVVEKGDVLEHALKLCAKLSKQSPIAVNYCKELIMGTREQPMSVLFQKERDLFLTLFETQDRKEGVQAFLEKRSPQWKNN